MVKIRCSRKAKLCQKINPSIRRGGLRVDGELSRTIKTSNYPDFYKKVWLECLKIESGQTSAYSEIAEKIGHPNSQRAVGTALSKNPFVPEVPCHRVIRKNGGLGGYSKGPAIKKKLLRLERKD